MRNREDTILMDDRQFNNSNFAILKAIESMQFSLAYLYDKYGYNNEFTKILVPISIFLHNPNTIHSKLNDYKALVLEHQILLTLNLLEHFEIDNCLIVEYNYEIFQKQLQNTQLYTVYNYEITIDYDIQYIETQMNLVEILNETTKYAPLTWIEKFIPNDYFKYHNSRFNSKRIYWDGIESKLEDVLLNLNENKYIIDNNYLVRFILLKLKWFVHNVFKKMLYIAIHFNVYPFDEVFNETNRTLLQIKDILSMFQSLSFPELIKKYLNFIIHSYKSIFDKNLNVKKQQKIITMIKNELIYLDVNTSNDMYDNEDPNTKNVISLDQIYDELEEDRNFLIQVLKYFKNNSIIPNEIFFCID